MHFATIGIFLATAVTSARACIVTHAYIQLDGIAGWTLSAQAWNNGVETCNGGSFNPNPFISDDTQFCIDGCQSGISLCITRDLKTAVYKDPWATTHLSLAHYADTPDRKCGDDGRRGMMALVRMLRLVISISFGIATFILVVPFAISVRLARASQVLLRVIKEEE